MLFFLLFLFVLGAHVGSFLNVCIWRLPRGESIVQPPSHCPHCKTRLGWLDLVPLLSQLFLRGRCRYCGAKFSWRYFGIELLTGVLFALAGAHSFTGDPAQLPELLPQLLPPLLRDLIFVAALVVIFWVDYDTRLIQLEAVLLLGLIGVGFEAWQVAQGRAALTSGTLFETFSLLPAPLPGSLLAMTVTASGLWLMREGFSWFYGKEALGFGDVMLVAGIAANLGWNATIFTFFFLSVVVGALVGVVLKTPRAIRAFRWARARQSKYSTAGPPAGALARHAFRKAMPFGPMLAVGAIIALLYGQDLNQAYMQRLTPPPNSIPLMAPAMASVPALP